jgi:hypothetical protein
MPGTTRSFPALTFYGVLGTIAAFVIKFASLTPVQGAYVATVVVGLSAVLTALRTSPVPVSILTGFATTVLTGLATFGLHVSSGAVAVIVAVITFVAGHFIHTKVSPTNPQSRV